LTASHPVNIIVDAHNGYVDISTTRMNQVITANSSNITIAAYYYDFQLGVGNLHALCECTSSSVSGMDCACFEIARSSSGTTDA
jgi:hypothetical protein